MTVKELFSHMAKSNGLHKNCISVFDKTGNLNFGCYYEGEALPEWLSFCEVESFEPTDNELFIAIKDFRGDLELKKEYQQNCIVYRGVKIVGFDFEKVGGILGKYEPVLINIDNGDKITKVKFKDCGFKFKGYQYCLRDVIKY